MGAFILAANHQSSRTVHHGTRNTSCFAFHPKHTVRLLQCGRLSRQPSRSLTDRRIFSNYNRNSNGDKARRPPRPLKMDSKTMIELALPTLGLVAAASIIAPILGGLVISALGLGLAIAALGAALSVSWVLIPLLVPLVGVPLLIGGGVLAGLFAIPALIQLGVIAAGLGVGAWVARTLVFGNGEVEQAASDTIVDVEVETVENWVSDLDKDAKQREKELREFDEMLKQRDRFRSKY